MLGPSEMRGAEPPPGTGVYERPRVPRGLREPTIRLFVHLAFAPIIHVHPRDTTETGTSSLVSLPQERKTPEAEGSLTFESLHTLGQADRRRPWQDGQQHTRPGAISQLPSGFGPRAKV